MSRDLASLKDILDACYLIQLFISSLDQAGFEEDIKTQYAVIRCISIIGEAASGQRLSEVFKQAHPEIPWRKMTNMRNILVHAYDDVVLEELWVAATESVPELIRKLEPLFPKES